MKELREVLENPSLLKKQDRIWLERLVREYPWFTLAHLLLAKKYKLDGNSGFENKLNTAAAYAPDRVALYHLIREKFQEQDAVDEIIPAKETPIRIPEEKKTHPPVPEQKKKPIQLTDNDDLNEMLRKISESKRKILEVKAHEEIIPENISSSEETEAEKAEPVAEIPSVLIEELKVTSEAGDGEFATSIEDLDEESENMFAEEDDAEIQSEILLEEEFIFNELENEFNITEVNKLSEAEAPLLLESDSHAEEMELHDADEETAIELENLIEESSSPVTSEFNEVKVEPEPEDAFRINKHVESPGEFLPDKTYTFSEWLKFFNPSKKKPAEQKKAPEEKITGEENSDELFFIPPPTITQDFINQNLRQEFEAIDKAMGELNQNKIAEKQISAEELAQKSIEPNDDLVTETLAGIYEQQGKLDKAIRIYARLSLLHPEKVSFFAARIKELKSKK